MFAGQVLQQPLVQAALEVKGAGPNAVHRAGELVVAALAANTEDTETEAEGKSVAE